MQLAKYIGIPYVANGRTLEGIDCFGLIIEFYKNELNLIIPDYLPEHIHHWKNVGTMEELPALAVAHEETTLEPYDVLWIRMLDTTVFRVLNHVAIYLGDGRILETSESTGSVITKLKDRGKYIHKIYRYGEQA